MRAPHGALVDLTNGLGVFGAARSLIRGIPA
jgi:hypothetical protein